MNDPLFLHEYIERARASLEHNYKEDLKSLERLREAEKLFYASREILQELIFLGYDPNFSMPYCWHSYISLSLRENDTIKDDIPRIIDSCEKALELFGFKMDVDTSNQENAFYSLNFRDDYDTINVSIYVASSTKCKPIKVRKMIESTTYVCEDAE